MGAFPEWQTIALRVLVIAVSLVAWFVTQRMIGARSVAGGAVYDHFHVLTARWNAWLHQHPPAANAILVASSLCVDAVTLFVLFYAVFGPSFAPFWGLFGLFALRQLSQAAVALRRALLRQRSGTVRIGRFFQAVLAPFLARFGSLGLRRRIQAGYFDVS